MESETQTVDVEAPADRVFDILTDPAAMLSWTNGFVLSARKGTEGRWNLETRRGALSWRVVAHAEARTVDFYTEEDGPGRATYARVLPRDGGCVVMLTMIRWPHIDKPRFAEMKRALSVELELIKRLAESIG